jgi:peptidyl-tRNA hydrolase, PTH1 family
MKLIVGLGNPGEKYESTRHNLGFMVLDHLLKDIESVSKSNWSKEEKLKSEIYAFDYQPKNGMLEKVILAKPLTYMNNSGMAVGLIARFYKIKPEDIWIIHDELDLPLGSLKIRLGGGGAGHHGIESIMENLGTDKFWRFRLGIGLTHNHDEIAKHKVNGQEFVLKGFRGGEASKARLLVKRGTKAIQVALEKGLESAMNQFNTK